MLKTRAGQAIHGYNVFARLPGSLSAEEVLRPTSHGKRYTVPLSMKAKCNQTEQVDNLLFSLCKKVHPLLYHLTPGNGDYLLPTSLAKMKTSSRVPRGHC